MDEGKKGRGWVAAASRALSGGRAAGRGFAKRVWKMDTSRLTGAPARFNLASQLFGK